MDDRKAALIRRLNEKIICNPNDLESLLSRGRAYHEKGCLDEAIRDYTQAININPECAKRAGVYTECAKVYAERGLAYRRRKSRDKKADLERAIKDYDKAIELNSNYPRVFADRGYAYNNIGEYDDAINDLTTAIDKGCTNKAEAYNQRGNAYRRKGCLRKAYSDYKNAIAINKHYAPAYNSMGNYYRDLVKNEKALKYYTKAIKLGPKKAAMTYINRGNVYHDMGYHTKAVEDFDNAVRLCSNNWRDNFADVKFALGGGKAIDKAIELIKTQADRGCPISGEQAYYKGVFFQLMNNPKAAKKNFNCAEAKGYNKERATEHLNNLKEPSEH